MRPFRSPRLAALLIFAIGFLILLTRFDLVDSVIFQAARLESIYSSWLFVGLLALLVLNVSVCTLYRVLGTLTSRRSADTLSLSRISKAPNYASFDIEQRDGAEETSERITDFLRLRHYTVRRSINTEGRCLEGERGRAARWADHLFHIALVVVILGGAVTALTRFSGNVRLVEGEVLVDDRASYRRINYQGPLFGDGFSGISAKLSSFEPRYQSNGMPRNYYCTLSFSDGWESEQHGIHISSPASYRGLTVYADQLNGVAALLTILDERDAPVYSTFVKFYKPDRPGSPMRTDFEAKEYRFRLRGRLYAGGTRGKGAQAGDWLIGPRPVLYAEISEESPGYTASTRSGSGHQSPVVGRVIYRGKMRNGVAVPTANKKKIRLDGLAYWSSFTVVRDEGYPLISLGFWASLLSLGTLAVLNERKISVIIEELAGGKSLRIHVSGKSAKYKGSFKEEFNDLVIGVRQELGVSR